MNESLSWLLAECIVFSFSLIRSRLHFPRYVSYDFSNGSSLRYRYCFSSLSCFPLRFAAYITVTRIHRVLSMRNEGCN